MSTRPPPQRAGTDVAIMPAPRLPFAPAVAQEFALTETDWYALVEAIFPNAKNSASVMLALAYCKKRGLDPFKRPVHIVPIWSSDKNGFVDTIWPGISEIRTTAMRTKQYAGCDRIEWGPRVRRVFSSTNKEDVVTRVELEFPEFGQMTVYKFVEGVRVAVHGPEVYWLETYAPEAKWSEIPNAMWIKRTRGQLEKCVEAAALRRAFPEELGNDYIPEEAESVEYRSRAARDVTPPGEAKSSKRPERADYEGDYGEYGAEDPPKDAKPKKDKAAKQTPEERWRIWVDDMKGLIAKCDTADKLSALLETRAKNLTILTADFPEMRQEVRDAVAEQGKKLSEAPAENAEKIDKKIDSEATEKDEPFPGDPT